MRFVRVVYKKRISTKLFKKKAEKGFDQKQDLKKWKKNFYLFIFFHVSFFQFFLKMVCVGFIRNNSNFPEKFFLTE